MSDAVGLCGMRGWDAASAVSRASPWPLPLVLSAPVMRLGREVAAWALWEMLIFSDAGEQHRRSVPGS